jgi:hypothetical protein
MYPSPSSAYRPQIPQQQPPLIPQTINQNTHSLPPPPPSSSTHPYPQYNHNSNTAASGHPPLVPQPMARSTAGPINQQNNNLNGPLPVSILFCYFCV